MPQQQKININTTYTLHVDQENLTAVSSNPSEEEEQLSLDPPEEGEDDDEEQEEPTAAEILQAAIAQGQLDKEMVSIDQREVDETEDQLIQRFVQDSCKCDLGPNRSPCCTTITVEHFRSVCCQMAELTPRRARLGCHGSGDGRLLCWRDILTPQAGEGKIIHDFPSQWCKGLPEDLPLPPYHGLLVLQSHQG